MKNITVSLDDDTYRRARIRAAERDTSVSAMVKAFLVGVAGEESPTERAKRDEARWRDAVLSFRAGDRLSRDDLHARDA